MVSIEQKNTNPQFSKAHLTNLNTSHFKTIEAMVFKLLHRGPLEGHYFRPNFIKIYQEVQKLLAGTHRQTGYLISLLLFLENRLKIKALFNNSSID
jgi:hypothetical protein